MSNVMSLDKLLKSAIVSSRIRVARNMQSSPFPIALTLDKGKQIKNEVTAVLLEKTELSTFAQLELGEMEFLQKKILVEKNLAGDTVLSNSENKCVLCSDDEQTSVLVNDEDHIRIQNLQPGLELVEAWKIVSRIDDQIDGILDYAFDEKLGYLTSCPTNVGTGLRASVLIHLPGLTLTGYMDRIYQAANQIGMAIRGTFGEGSEIYGSMYQISNHITLGRSEIEIIGTLNQVTKEILRKEKDACETLLSGSRQVMEDKVFRALGVLQNARIITLREAVDMLSDVRLGVYLGIISDISEDRFDNLLIDIQDGNLQSQNESFVGNIDYLRAEYIRGKFSV